MLHYCLLPVGSANSPVYVKSQKSSVVINGLSANTKYEWKVENYCNTIGQTGNYMLSGWSPVSNFTTLKSIVINCSAPQNLTTLNSTQNTATLKWNKVSSAKYYIVSYYQQNATTF